jgi:hypothetical protein
VVLPPSRSALATSRAQRSLTEAVWPEHQLCFARSGRLLFATSLPRPLFNALNSVRVVACGALRRCLGPISLLAVAMPPQRKLAAPAADDGNIHGEDEEAEGDHPKPDHGEKADETAGNKQDADAKADRLRLRQVELAIGEADLLLGHGDLSAGRHHIGMAADGRNRAAS